MSEEKARQLAEMFGGNYLDSGGGVYVVFFTRQDGIVVAMTEEVVASYPDVDSIGDEGAMIDHIDLV